MFISWQTTAAKMLLRVSDIKAHLYTKPQRFGLITRNEHHFDQKRHDIIGKAQVFFRDERHYRSDSASIKQFGGHEGPIQTLAYRRPWPDHFAELDEFADEVSEKATVAEKAQIDLASICCIAKYHSKPDPRKQSYISLERRYHTYMVALQENPEEKVWNTFNMYNYVWMNATILNVPFKTVVNRGYWIYTATDGSYVAADDFTEKEFSSVLESVRREIDEMVPRLRTAINKLD